MEKQMSNATDKAKDTVFTLSKLLELYGSLMLGLQAVFAFLGKVPTDEKAKTAKVVFGLFGMEDERKFFELLLVFSNVPEDRWMIIEFLKFLFPRGTTEEKIITWYCGNRFRVFVVQMTPDNSKKFLNDTVSRIKLHGANDAGYKIVQDELLSQSVPIPSGDTAKSLKEARETLLKTLKQGGPAAMKAAVAVGTDAIQWVETNVPPAIAQARTDAETKLNNLRSQQPTTVFERLLRRMK